MDESDLNIYFVEYLKDCAFLLLLSRNKNTHRPIKAYNSMLCLCAYFVETTGNPVIYRDSRLDYRRNTIPEENTVNYTSLCEELLYTVSEQTSNESG